MRVSTGVLLLALTGAGAAAQAADLPPPSNDRQLLTISREPPPPSSRLKYRNGPVCICSDGLSEADILRAQQGDAAKNQSSADFAPAPAKEQP